MTRASPLLAAIVASTLLAALLGGCAASRRAPTDDQVPVPEVEILRREERLALPDGTRALRVSNLHGDVRVRFAGDGELRLIATVQRIGEQPIDPDFRLAVEQGTAVVEVHYPGERQLLARGGHRYGRSDIVVVVPETLASEVETGDGLAQVRNARASVRVRTRGGGIDVSGASDIDLRSHGGRIGFGQTSGAWQVATVRSDGGAIIATVPAFADIVLDARASDISVDPLFPTTVGGQPGRRIVSASFGRALRTLSVDAGQGSLYLRAGIPPDAIAAPASGQRQ